VRVLSAVIALLNAPIEAEERQAAFSIEHLINTAEIRYAPISISPDGRYIAATLNRPSQRRPSAEHEDPFFLEDGTPREADGDELWVTQIKTGESFSLAGGVGASWGGIWSPDGQSLAFFSNRDGAVRLWLWSAASRAIRCISRAEAKAEPEWRQLWWSADGKQLLVRLVTEGPGRVSGFAAKNEGVATGISAFRSESVKGAAGAPLDTSAFAKEQGDLALVDVATGSVQRLVRNVPVYGYWPSPRNNVVAFTVMKPEPLNASDGIFDLMIVSAKGGKPRLLAGNIQQIWANTVSWSPDGTKIAYGSGTRSQIFDHRGYDQYYVVHSTGGPSTLVTPGVHASFEARVNQGPLWSADSKSLYLLGSDALWRAAANGGGLLFIGALPGRALRTVIGAGAAADRIWSPDQGKSARVITIDPNTMAMGFARVELHGGPMTQLFEENAVLGSGANGFFGTFIAASGNRIVYARETAHEAPDFWTADSAFADRRRLTQIDPGLDRYTFGKSRLISWHRADGQLLRGVLLLPSDYEQGHRYPLVVDVYGGAYLSKYLNTFGAGSGVANAQLFATRGYAMLMPDTPINGNAPVHDIVQAVLPGVDQLIELGIADSTRIAIMGHSYGGYSTMAVITQSPRFKAAINVSGMPSDLFTAYGAIRKGDGVSTGVALIETGQGRMGGTPWEVRDRYIANSPFFVLDRVSTPLLIISSTGDQAVPWYGGDELFTALRRLGKEVEYVKYDSEDHSPSEWSPAHLRDYYGRIIIWLDRFLRPSEK
jgi:dipeptidyl aminopeptidase/acylaminoacyl peptidase